MRKVIEAFNKMPPRDLIDCRITGLRDILLYNGIELSSFMLFVIGQGIDFSFEQLKRDDISNILIWWSGGSTVTLENDILDNLSIAQEKYFFNNDEQGWKQLKQFIDNDVPVMVVLDSNYIHVDTRIEKDLSRSYIGALSSGPLVGYDTEQDIVLMDFKGDASTDLYSISIKDFMIARDTKCFPYSPANECYIVKMPLGYKKWLNDNLAQVAANSLLETCTKMLAENGDKYKYTGIHGIEVMAEVINEFRDNLQGANLPEEISNKIFSLKFNCLRQGMLPGSNTFYRYEFGRGVEETAGLLKKHKLKKLAGKFMESGNKWRQIIRLLGTTDYNFGDKDNYFAKVHKELINIADYEKELFYQLKFELL